MQRTWIVGAGIIALGAVAYLGFGRDPGSKGSSAPVATDAAPAPPAPARSQTSGPDRQQVAAQLQMDADPIGSLRLEGVVLDDADDPVAGAMVYLDARPPRTTTSGADGSFGFDALVGRRYALRARAGAEVGGPLVVELTETSDPAVIRLRAGGIMEISVVSRDGAGPISGATVGVEELRDLIATTDGDGVASLRGVPIGWGMLVVRAPGFATSRTPFRVPETPGAPLHQRIELEPGIAVRGVVVDEGGKPVAGARVVARANAAPWEPVDILGQGVATDRAGRFAIEALSAGSYRFLAVHDDYAPGSSELVAISESSQPEVRIGVVRGAVVAGRVFDAAGAPAAWARVTLTTSAGQLSDWGGGTQRKVVAGEAGEFRIRGLARSEISVYASTASASSDIVTLDLRARAETLDLELRLTVLGAIAGTVLDEAGQPIAEAQVVAQPDFWSGHAAESFTVRGASFGTTDGGGRFSIGGLAPGRYLLRASRTDLAADRGLAKPVGAEVGDTAVRIVLATEGSIRGTIRLADGGAPSVASVALAGGGAAPAVEGRFVIDAVPPGTYDVTVRGIDFPDKVLPDVEVEAGKPTELGTIVVDRGRAVFGRVLDAGGSPVAGARVALARQLIGDGANLVTALDETTEQQLGLRRAVSDAAGRYRIGGIGDEPLALAAEHPEHGGSLAAQVPRGTTDVPIDLALLPLGAVFGSVTVNHQPASSVSIVVTGVGGAQQVRVGESGLDGTFAIEGIPAGEHKVAAMLGAAGTASMASAQAMVVAGQRVEVTLDIPAGDITLEVAIAGKDGARVDAAQVFVFDNPALSARTGGDLNRLFLSESEAGASKMAFSTGGQPARFEAVSAGKRTLCAVPITGDLNDPVFAERLQRDVDRIAVYCSPLTIAPAPASQTHPLALPEMSFL
ncbi:MAG TPA: carboxypeptidase-like regulatory domain-containing protein [Kofleriaceae bacterium]|nr:carboxypeptidase-like regulatory domain-containing protein [Kofleriaceae bacterium]